MTMRQIKFRGKQLNGEWAYGDLLRIGGGCIIYIGSKTETQTPDIPKESNVAVELFDNDIAIVIPSTLGQFTGLIDRNGKEIYEGDIIKVDELAMPCEVIWYDKTASFQLRYHVEGGFNIPKDALGLWIQDYKSVITVVGNIHDNPELFNEK